MKPISFFLFFLFSNPFFAQQPAFVENELVVRFKAGIELNSVQSQLSDLDKTFGLANRETLFPASINGKDEAYSLFLERVFLFKFLQKIDIQTAIEAYFQTGLFDYVEPNYFGSGGGVEMDCPPPIVPNEPIFSRQWGLLNDGTFSLDVAKMDADIDMDLAWDLEQGDSNVTIAILDSGFKLDHPEFAGRIWKNTLEIPGNMLDDDRNGFVDDHQGWDFVNQDNNPTDDHGHGTNVAGIAAATGNNGSGYAGVDWNAKVMILKILDSQNFGTYVNWALAIRYAADNGADIFNMSVGGSGFSQVMQDAIRYANTKGSVVVACMMNTNTSVPYYPAAYPETIAVGSTDADDTRTNPFFWSNTSGSNYGTHIDLVAPGNFIYGLSHTSNTNFGSYWGGTSQACPLAVGVGALLLAQDPTRTTTEIRKILRETADDLVGRPGEDSPGFDQYYGAGRLNAYKALLPLSDTKNLNEKQGDFYVFPNPLGKQNERIKFRLPENFGGQATCSVADGAGKVIFFQNLNFNGIQVFEIPFSLPAGMYIAKLETEKGFYSSKFFIQ